MRRSARLRLSPSSTRDGARSGTWYSSMRPKFPETAFPLAPSHTVLLRAPPSCFNMTLLHAAIDGQRHGIQQVGFSPRGARPPLLGCLQFASGGSAPGNILAGPPAPPPHDHARHGKYQWEDSRQEHCELPDRAAVAALVDPSDPLRRTVSGERPWQAFHVAAAIVHHDGGGLAAHRIPQLHAPSGAGGIPA